MEMKALNRPLLLSKNKVKIAKRRCPNSREHTEAAGQNVELSLKSCSIQLDKVRTATQRYLTALRSPVGSLPTLYDATRNSPSSRRQTEGNVSLSSLITSPVAVTDHRNKTSSTVGRVIVDASHPKYLNSPNDSRWVAQCLSGGKCIKETSKEKYSRNNRVTERLALNNPIMGSTKNSSSTLLRISAKSVSEISEISNHDGSRSSVSGNSSHQDKLNPSDVEIGNFPSTDISRFKPINYTISEKNNSLAGELNQSQGMNSTAESTSNSDDHVFPQNMTGEKVQYKSSLHMIPLPVERDNRLILPISVEDDQLTSDSDEELTSLTRAQEIRKESIRPDILAENEKASQKTTKDDKSLPISIQFQPVIHNHYYNRRQTKSAQNSSEEPSIPDYEFPPIGPIAHQNFVANESNNQEKMEGEMKSPKFVGRCDHPNTPGCDNWASMQNLAAGDIVTRFSTGKRQSDGNAIDEADSESVMKTEIQNTKFHKELETFPSNKNANSNIFLFMGGQWLVNFKENPETFKIKSKTPDALPNIIFQQKQLHPSKNNERASSVHSRFGYHRNCLEHDSKMISFSDQPTPGTFQKRVIQPEALSSYHNEFGGKTNFPHYSVQNGIPVTRTFGKASTWDDIDYSNSSYDDYSQAVGEFNVSDWEKKYYYVDGVSNHSPETNLPLSTNVIMNYPESMVNFPLNKINKYQGDNLGYQKTSVKPEEYALHDMNPSDMVVVGAQLLSTIQTPETSQPDPEYPLEPVSIENDYISLLNNFPSARDSLIAGHPKQPDSVYNYKNSYQIPSFYNTSHSSEGHKVWIPQQILINDQALPNSANGSPFKQALSNSWLGNSIGEYEFVNGQYVKKYRSAGVASKENGYYSSLAENPPTRNSDGCQEQNQRNPRTIIESDVTHHNHHYFDYGPYWPYGLPQNI